MTGLWLLLLVGSLLLVIVLLATPERDAHAVAEGSRPAPLWGAVAVASNVALHMTAPFKLHGTPDVIYRTRRGTLVVREDKAGGFPHPDAELIQLSAYAAMLRSNPPPVLAGLPVEPYGYVRYGTPGRTRVRWRRVVLLTDAQLGALVARYRVLGQGAPARQTLDRGYCERVCRHFGTRCSGRGRPH
ncbi:hypothetical protein [Rhodanobacter sp. FW106-PBR-R2A-1-13]|uniref:hypothetical protein n=1 Tax=Rhodanobacter sp. FW106-PBR-R2A-1-13 TaxID=3454845 RepID=UPI0034E59ECC